MGQPVASARVEAERVPRVEGAHPDGSRATGWPAPRAARRAGLEETVLVGHEALLTLARKVDAAAIDGDPARVEDAARHLLNLLAVHVRAEEAALSESPLPAARLLQDGQERLLALVADLAAQAAEGCHIPPRECRYRTEELVAQLGVQARTERLRGFASAA